jgi:hypothetical protein
VGHAPGVSPALGCEHCVSEQRQRGTTKVTDADHQRRQRVLKGLRELALVPSDHHTVLTKPYVEVVAADLRGPIRRATAVEEWLTPGRRSTRIGSASALVFGHSTRSGGFGYRAASALNIRNLRASSGVLPLWNAVFAIEMLSAGQSMPKEAP